MKRFTTIVITAFVSLATPSLAQADEAAAPTAVSYHRDVRPIFQANCQGCHQPAKALGDYVMTTAEWLMKPGETGDAPIVPGKPDESPLYRAVLWEDYEMPPKENDRLTEKETEAIRQWIAEGAPWPDEATPSSPMPRDESCGQAVERPTSGRIAVINLPTSGHLSR